MYLLQRFYIPFTWVTDITYKLIKAQTSLNMNGRTGRRSACLHSRVYLPIASLRLLSFYHRVVQLTEL